MPGRERKYARLRAAIWRENEGKYAVVRRRNIEKRKKYVTLRAFARRSIRPDKANPFTFLFSYNTNKRLKSMKKIALLGLMAWSLSLCPAHAHDQEVPETEKETRINVKINGLALIGIVNPAVEFKVTDRGTVQLEGIGMFYPHGFPGTNKPITLGATFGEFRYYPREAFHGFYAGPSVGWGVYRLAKNLLPGYGDQHHNQYQVGHNMMFALSVGYTFCIGRHWSIEANWGTGYQNSRYEGFNNDGTRYVGLNGSGEWLPICKIGLFVGYRF